MISDRELDDLLVAAAGVRDADLPNLPDDLLDLVTADAGPSLVAAADVGREPASVVAARQLVADAHEARTAPRPRRPRRRTLVRVATAVVAIAAAWTTAVVVAPRESPDPRRTTPSTGAPVSPGEIALVAGEPVVFPLSLDPAPEGLTPTFSRRGGVAAHGSTPPFSVADYSSADGDRVLVSLFPEDPRSNEDYGFRPEGDPTGTATVDGVQAGVWPEAGGVSLLWQRPGGQWVWLLGEGDLAGTGALVAVGESLVDRPQPVGLHFGLAPAGWSVGGYEESRSLDLVSDTDPEQLLRVSLVGREYPGTLDELLEGISFAEPPEPVTVQGQPARLALASGDGGSPYRYLVGQLDGGPFFVLLAPEALTQEQVLQIAEQVTYTP
ncbi:hypothetical protein JOD57_002476 [Geodermatophilus bullaregiensis]|uniref:hypothetical protein n=1 Tax=Geodermatophilus bullaregiensis TaxID=1564160 RepID=UPI0019563E1A|nr:hypothetical protein [Geodermatophilus bullaregiensis]MBM7806639.1 hypothetical protein [Geodermatophilus bullaregiensis]